MANTSHLPRPRDVAPNAAAAPRARAAARRGRTRLRSRLAGGADGNERLTVLSGVLLLMLFAGMGITILRMGQLLWLHLFPGARAPGVALIAALIIGLALATALTGHFHVWTGGQPGPAVAIRR